MKYNIFILPRFTKSQAHVTSSTEFNSKKDNLIVSCLMFHEIFMSNLNIIKNKSVKQM